MATPLRAVIVSCDYGRWTWQFETVNGNHSVTVQSGTAYRTVESARGGAERFIRLYLAVDAPVSIGRKIKGG